MPTTAMFWRIVRRLLTANYARLFVILLALGAGAAVTSALLNLQIDAKRRLTTEFRALGANVIVTPRDSGTEMARRWMRPCWCNYPHTTKAGRCRRWRFSM